MSLLNEVKNEAKAKKMLLLCSREPYLNDSLSTSL